MKIVRRTKLTILSQNAYNLRYQIDYMPDGGEQLRLVAASYDLEGRLLKLGFKDLTAAGGTEKDVISITGWAPKYRLFLLDSKNRPVAECALYPNS